MLAPDICPKSLPYLPVTIFSLNLFLLAALVKMSF